MAVQSTGPRRIRTITSNGEAKRSLELAKPVAHARRSGARARFATGPVDFLLGRAFRFDLVARPGVEGLRCHARRPPRSGTAILLGTTRGGRRLRERLSRARSFSKPRAFLGAFFWPQVAGPEVSCG